MADDTRDSYGAIAEMMFYGKVGRDLTPKPTDVPVGMTSRASST